MLSTISALVRALLPITGVSWVVLEARQGRQRRPEAASADRGSAVALRLSIAVAALGAVLVKKLVPGATIGTEEFVDWMGLLMLWCGAGLRLWSFQTLGRYFTFTVQTSQDQPVISAGPYRIIRHPGYAGFLVAVVGLGFVLDSWVSLIVLAGATASGVIYRIAVEERALARELGGRYQSYAASRKRLVPFVW